MNEKSHYQKYDERAKALRHHPMVEAWITAKQTAFEWSDKHPDCRHCTFPHHPGLLCGQAPFGELRIGGELYSVSWSNVCWFVEFREKPREGFHWRNDIYFRVMPEHIEVTSYWQYNNSPQERVWKIPRNEWESIVDFTCSPHPTTERQP